MTICKHKQLQRQCELCQAAEAIKEAYFEGYATGFDNADRVEPKHGLSESEYQKSDARVNSEST